MASSGVNDLNKLTGINHYSYILCGRASVNFVWGTEDPKDLPPLPLKKTSYFWSCYLPKMSHLLCLCFSFYLCYSLEIIFSLFSDKNMPSFSSPENARPQMWGWPPCEGYCQSARSHGVIEKGRGRRGGKNPTYINYMEYIDTIL